MEIQITADTLWVLIAAVLIFLMGLGFACVESGFTRTKNCVNVLSKNFIVVAVATIAFWFFGFGLMFGDGNPFFGLKGVMFMSGGDNSPSTGDNYKGVYSALGWVGIPLAAKFFVDSKKVDAVICLGAVIRGETPHFDYVAGESAKGIAEISRSVNIPIINGILTTDNARQAEDRSQVDGRNKGWDAIEAALQTISIYQEIFSAAKC